MGGTRVAARTRRRVRRGALIVALLVPAPAQAAPQLVKVGDFQQPTYATGDASRVFVTERPGRVRVVRDGTVLAQPLLDLTPITLADGQERGLLSAAFTGDGRVYVYLTVRAAASVSGTDGELQVREYRRSSPDVADPASGRLLLAIRHDEAPNHNGGQLQLGPDGRLWLATGDGGGANDQFGHAQDPASLLGKLIRLDPAAPSPEVLARGLRNPWRFSFDRANGQLVIADVGQGEVEEIDVGLGANYGWPCFEGDMRRASNPACDTGTVEPTVTKTHLADGFCSITGGYVVRDPGLPTLLGRYLYGDFCAPELRSVDLSTGLGDAPIGLSVPSLSSFGEDTCGRIFAVSLNGPVYRLVDGSPSPCTSPAPPPGPAPARDARACRLSARVSGLRSVRRLRRVRLSLRADEPCRVTVSGRIRGVARLRTARASLAAGRRQVVRLRLPARRVRAVRRALGRHRSLKLTLRVQAVDRAGNIRALARAARVRG